MAVEGRHRAAEAGPPTDAHALLDAVEAIGSDLDLDGVLRRIVESSCALTDAEYGVLAIVDEAGEFTELITHGMAEDEIARIGQMPVGHGLLGAVPQQRRAMRVDDVTRHPASAGYPGEHPHIGSFLGAPVMVGEKAFGHLYLGNKRGGLSFSDEDEAYVVALARSAGTLIRHAAAYEESQRRRAWLEASVRVAAALSPTARVGEALEQLVREVEDVSGADSVALVQFDGVSWEVGAHTGRMDSLHDKVGRLEEQFAEAAQTGEPVRVPADEGRTELIVPLRTELAETGVLLLSLTPRSVAMRGLEQELLQAFAAQVSLALDRAHAMGERHELLLAADRDRIGRDLHDLVIQRLYATGLQLQAARAGGDPERMAAGLEAGVKELDLSIRDLRATIFELGRGIGQQLRDEVRALNTEYATVLGFLPTLRTSGPVDSVLSAAGHDQLLLTLREALSNVARHAQATQVTVELVASAQWFMLRVVDDGVGLGSDPGPGSGILNAQHRAEKLGGLLRLAPAQPRGTSLTWMVPAGA